MGDVSTVRRYRLDQCASNEPAFPERTADAMNDKRAIRMVALAELVAIGFAFYLLNRESMPNIGLAVQRAGYLTCQQIARGFGALAIELEKGYRTKVAP
jgi:hypothetical protein